MILIYCDQYLIQFSFYLVFGRLWMIWRTRKDNLRPNKNNNLMNGKKENRGFMQTYPGQLTKNQSTRKYIQPTAFFL